MCESDLIIIMQQSFTAAIDKIAANDGKYNNYGIECLQDYIEIPHHSFDKMKENMLRICSLTNYGRHYSREMMENWIYLLSDFMALTAESNHGTEFTEDNLKSQIDQTLDMMNHCAFHYYKLKELQEAMGK